MCTFESVPEFEDFFRKYDTLIIDGTEHPIQRPSEEDSQKDNYSGKKKAHTKNNSHNRSERLWKRQKDSLFELFLRGKNPRLSEVKRGIPPELNWFENFNVRLDSGYQGFAKDYTCRQVSLPTKARKKHPLTDEQRISNRELASQRIGIEPLRRTDSIGRLKRYRIAADRLRMHDFGKYDGILEVCADHWNFYVMN